MQRTDSLEKTLMLRKIEGRRRRGRQRMRWLDGLTNSMDMSLSKLWTWVWASSGSWWWTGRSGMLQCMGHKESDTTERLNWTELSILALRFSYNDFIILKYVLYPICWQFFFNHYRVLNFDKCLFFIYWDDHMIFILHSVNVACHINSSS